MKTSKPLLTLRMLFPAAASFIVLLLGEWIARGSLTADTFISFIFPHFGAYLLAWLLLFLVWLLLDWVFRCPPLSTLGMAVLGCAPCAVNFYTLQLRGEPFLPWDLTQVSEAAGVASAAGLKIQPSMVVTIIVVLVLMAVSIITVGTTIRLSVFARRREIEIMKYVGATNALVTLPFVIEGLVMGLISGIITAAASIGGYAYIVEISPTLGSLWQMLMGMALVPLENVWPTILTYSLVAGALVGGLGSMFSIRKHLNV